MIGQTISHYRILEKLGEGGMGVVYKARDTRLDRDVALKFLPAHLSASEEDKARFLQEAKAAAALNHPNICTIHGIEESDGQDFIVMEYVEGATLRDIVRRSSLPLNDATGYAIQIGDALEEAHSIGVVHRDVKAENIMVNVRKQVKVMDFGLAKLKGSRRLTKTTSTVGTLAYMAPEQIQGGDVDARSDIFSFGVVFFEMLTGRLPFRGEHEAALMYSIVNEEPDSLRAHLPGVPSEVVHIMNRALAKNPESRYQEVHDMTVDLRRVMGSAGSDEITQEMEKTATIGRGQEPATMIRGVPRRDAKKGLVKWMLPVLAAVAGLTWFLTIDERHGDPVERLPIIVADFVNQTGESELDGLSGMLSTALEQSPRLSVVTRSRMFDILEQMGRKDVGMIDEATGRQICQQAKIGAMVMASIRKFGKLYTIDLKIIDPERNEYLFTTKEEAEGQESIPSMLDRLSEATRIGLKERVAQVQEGRQSVASVTTTNLEAYQHFFQGEQFINQLKFERAIDEFVQAVALDSSFALAYYRMAYVESWLDNREGISKAHLERALNDLDRMPERMRYLVRAQDALESSGYRAGIAILKEMEQKYPDDQEMIYNIGDWSYHVSDFHAAVEYLSRALESEPDHQRALQHLTWAFRDLSDYASMLETAKRHTSVSGQENSYQLLADAYTELGQFELGIQSLKHARDLFPENYRITGSIAYLYAYQGDYARAEEELNALVTNNQISEVRNYGYHQLSFFYPYLGKYRKALKAIERRIELLRGETDTVQIAIEQVHRGIKLIYGWNDSEAAWSEVTETHPVQPGIRSIYFWGSVCLVQVYRGDYAQADSLAQSSGLPWWNQAIQSLMSSRQLDLERAEVFADSIMQSGSSFAKIFVLYPLAECQYERGEFDKALSSLSKLQHTYDSGWTRGIYYPKSFYLMGKIYEERGDRDRAVENYERFLMLWTDADEDLPDLIDGKNRMANLKGML